MLDIYVNYIIIGPESFRTATRYFIERQGENAEKILVIEESKLRKRCRVLSGANFFPLKMDSFQIILEG